MCLLVDAHQLRGSFFERAAATFHYVFWAISCWGTISVQNARGLQPRGVQQRATNLGDRYRWSRPRLRVQTEVKWKRSTLHWLWQRLVWVQDCGHEQRGSLHNNAVWWQRGDVHCRREPDLGDHDKRKSPGHRSRDTSHSNRELHLVGCHQVCERRTFSLMRWQGEILLAVTIWRRKPTLNMADPNGYVILVFLGLDLRLLI